jgi:autoinducer 2-degrading protein
MYIILIWLVVKREFLDAFLLATLEMAQAALQESGTRRFEILRGDTDPTRFVLYKASNSRADHDFHLTTVHLQQWRETVTPMLAEPQQMDSYTQLF